MDIEKYLGKTIIAWHYYNENFTIAIQNNTAHT